MRAALLLLLFLACVPAAPPAHPKPAGTVVTTVFYHTDVNQERIHRGLDEAYRGLDVEFRFSYDLGPGLTLLITDETPEEWKLPPTAVGGAPMDCHRKTNGIGVVVLCSRNEDVCTQSGAHELAHLLGLEHVVGDDLMGSEYALGRRFTDRELPTLQHVCRDEQNSVAMLRQALGPALGQRP